MKMNMMTETTFSHDSDLEEAVIGACMIERAAMPLVADKLRPEMFYEEKNLEIFVALQSMYRSAKSIDTITLKNELAARGKLDAVGGPYELLRISSKVSSSAHLEYHALILRQLHTRRIMRTGFQQLLAFSADESMDIDDILVEAHRLLEGLEDESGVADHLRSIDRLMDDTLAEVEQRMEHGCNGITGIPTGFDALDHVTAGWQRGDLNILAARPSVGKTVFALHLARAAAMAGRHVVVFSLEMQGERLGDRWLLAATEGVDPQHLRSGQLTPGEVRQVHEASAELSRLPILIDDHPMTSMDRVRSSARLLKSKNRCDMVIVDYLQLCDMRSDQKNRNREQEVAQASRKAKLLAKELDIPVLLLSQLNRASDGSIDHRPTLSNLRESGAIEQDADMVMLLCRPALYGKTVDKKSTYPTDGLGIVIIAKHRNGKTGEVYFHHNQSMTKLVDYIPPLEWLTRNAK